MIVQPEPRLLAERYRLGDRIGAGGMGTVYAAFDERLDRPVAVKLLRNDFGRDPTLRRRFEREARSAARVSHPNAVAVFDTGEDAERDAFIVMELLSGRTLAQEIADGPLTEARLGAVADAVLSALEAAHGEGIVHRDVKPGNVLLGAGGEVKVGDFGIATTLDASETTAGLPLGTPAYTAPERLRGLPASPASDLYSLGVVLYEAATGTRPFTGATPDELARAVVRGEHRPLDSLRPDLDPAFLTGIERALANDPAGRFADAATMRSALSTDRAGGAGGAAAPTVPLPDIDAGHTVTLPRSTPPRVATAVPSRVAARPHDATSSWRRRVPWLTALAALLAVAIAAGVVLANRTGNDSATTTPTTSTLVAPTTVPGSPAGTGTEPAPIARALDRLEELTKP